MSKKIPSSVTNEDAVKHSGDEVGNQQNMPVQSAAGDMLSPNLAKDLSADDLQMVFDIPVKMTAELGRAKMTIKELLQLSQGSVVPLDSLAGSPLDVLINGYLIAQGEVVVVADKFGIRITDIMTPSERISRLSRQ